MFEHLYDVTEQAQVHFVGCVSEHSRYDFSIVYTKQFMGKPLVICMQTGRSMVLSVDDLQDTVQLQSAFRLKEPHCAEELSEFLRSRLPQLCVEEQY